MNRLLILGLIVLSQGPAFSQSQCPSGTTPIGQPQYRDYHIAGWKGQQHGYKCVLKGYLVCGDISMPYYASAEYIRIKVLSKENVWVMFESSKRDPLVYERRGFNKDKGEAYYQKVNSRELTTPGVSKVLQISTVNEEIQKCGSYSF